VLGWCPTRLRAASRLASIATFLPDQPLLEVPLQCYELPVRDTRFLLQVGLDERASGTADYSATSGSFPSAASTDPELDIDLAVESIQHPERYPLVSRK
jgi:hypothetical protein